MARFSKTAGVARGLLTIAICGATVRAGGYGFHLGSTTPAVYAAQLEDAGLDGTHGTWARMRELPDPAREGAQERVEATRDGLQKLKQRGVRTAVRLFGVPRAIKREGEGGRVPADLREAYAYGRRLGLHYDLVDVWEIHNEPDIGFLAENPETYAAYLKAMYLGVKAGAANALQPGLGRKIELKEPLTDSAWGLRKRSRADLNLKSAAFMRERRQPLVIMAPLALPPGPYLERLWENGIASYTDGFDFHYYGYAEDFTGVYRQFEDAVRTLDRRERNAGLRARRKRLPVFITEYGYGLLSGDARDTVEGRVRQWRWFAEVARQIKALRPEGPMAFMWTPFHEAGLNEFGLTMPMAAGNAGEGGANASQAADVRDGFAPGDFGLEREAPWMRRIGLKVGDWFASPALAYLWDYAERNPYRSRSWTVHAAPASPVVIDLISGRGMTQMKSSGGYLLDAASARAGGQIRAGEARLVIYNFGETEVAGRLESEPSMPFATLADSGVYILAPGERREVPLTLEMPVGRRAAQAFRVRFVPEKKDGGGAVFSTQLYVRPGEGAVTRIDDFGGTAEESRHKRIGSREVATDEPRLMRDGRWWTTDGVTVEDTGNGVWRFRIDYLPKEPLRPACAELPLPEKFTFPRGAFIRLDRRRVEPSSEPGALGTTGSGEAVPPDQLKPRAGKAGDMLDVYFRTENGNLFQTWPRLRVTTEWARYFENADNFTMAFYGRAGLPWRFEENRPTSLVFFFRPSRLPAIFEVQHAEIVRLGAE